MTTRNLDRLLCPGSVAIVGASTDPASVGGIIWRNMRAGGFAGPVLPVNPHHRTLDGSVCYPDAASLPLAPDLAVVVVPPTAVPAVIADLGAHGVKATIVITAGVGGGPGASLRQAMLDAARPHLLRIVGPNCLGVMLPDQRLNATFAGAAPEAGTLALVSQSGAILSGIADWARQREIGFSCLISLGDMADIDFGDLLDYLALDRRTSAILLYLEAITHSRKFMSAARAAARLKPVIVLKAGRHAEGARAVASHTGALAGSDAVYDAAFRRAGMLRVGSVTELFGAAEILARRLPIKGERLAIVTNGGGFGVLATDALIDQDGRLAELSPETLRALDAILPPTWSRGNPVDIIGDAPGRRYAETLAVLQRAPEVDMIVVLNCPTALASSVEAAETVVAALGDGPRKPVVAAWVGGTAAAEARRPLVDAGIPVYSTPEDAVTGVMHVIGHQRARATLMETPASVPEAFEADLAAARTVIADALRADRAWLDAREVGALLAAYRIPVVESRAARTADEAVAAAEALGFPVAVKIASEDIVHKSEVGGVALGLPDAAQVREAAARMLERVRAARPTARIDGLTVERMVQRRDAHELIIGASLDPQFGPVVLFGHGGTAVETIADRALALPPLTMSLAHDLIGRTRVHRLLSGYRDTPPADLAAVALTLVKLAQLVADHAEIVEIDLNPLLADAAGVVALDARCRIAAASGPPEGRLAIRPYPKELEEEILLEDGRRFLLRPIRPEDEPALLAAFRKLSPETVRMRLFAPLRVLTHPAAARLTQIDYDREMALVLADHRAAGDAQLYGGVRLIADPEGERAEFAITVRDDVAGSGLGRLLLERGLAYARQRGIGEVFGHVLPENTRMLRLCRRLGFEEQMMTSGSRIVLTRYRLRPLS